MRSRARATAYFAHAAAFPCTKECWGEPDCNAQNGTAPCNGRTYDAKPPESAIHRVETDIGACLTSLEYPSDPYIDVDKSACETTWKQRQAPKRRPGRRVVPAAMAATDSDTSSSSESGVELSSDESGAGEHVAICGRTLSQNVSVRRTTALPVDQKAGRHVLAVPLESLNVQLSAEASKKQSIVDFDDLVWQKVAIGRDGGLTYELSPFLRELLLGISTEGGSAHVGGSPMKAIRKLRQAGMEHSPRPPASADGVQLVRDANVRQPYQCIDSPPPALGSNVHQLVFDMPVKRVVIDPNGVAFLHAPSSWNVSELMRASMAIDDAVGEANCLRMCSPGLQCNTIVPLREQQLWGNVRRPRSAEPSMKTLTPAWDMHSVTTFGPQNATSIGFSAAAASHWDAMVASNAQRPSDATPSRLALTDGSPLSSGLSSGSMDCALSGIHDAQLPLRQAAPTDVTRLDSSMALRLASSSIPRPFCVGMPTPEILRDPIGCSTDAEDTFAIVPYQSRVDS